jgi:MoaA/NifB/PqqE/SkfB family radical SAM enzyme
MVNYVPNALTLIITDGCNSSCSICGHDKGDSHMPDEMMLECIDQAQEMGGIKYIVFSGGEPTTRYESLLKGTRHASSKGFEAHIVSNASYAENEDSAARFAKEMKDAGMIHITFSMDKEHQQHVPYANVLNAVKANLAVGIDTGIKTCYRKSTIDESHALIEAIATDIEGRLDEDSRHCKINIGEKEIKVSESFLARCGEAKSIRKSEFDKLKIRDYESCETNYMSVKTNGDILPSCSFIPYYNPFYVFGNVNETTLREAARRVNESFVDFMLSPYSFLRLKEFMEKSENPKMRKLPNKRYENICDFCNTVTLNAEFREPVLREFNRFKGAEPEIIFGGSKEKLVGDARVVVNGEELKFVDYLGPMSYKRFWMELGKRGVEAYKDLKGKRAEKKRIFFKEILEEHSKLKEADY